MKADIFISHIHDEEKVAKALQSFIESKFEKKLKVFLSSDHWQMSAGEVWLDRIREELTSAKVLVLMLSSRSVMRPWINFEAGAAWFAQTTIIPVCFGGLSKDHLPMPYADWHSLNLRDEAYWLLTAIAGHFPLFAPFPTWESTFGESAPPSARPKDEAFIRLWQVLDSRDTDGR